MNDKNIVVVGAGVAGMFAVTKLIFDGYQGNLITVIDAGKDPFLREPHEVMKGAFGAGLFSDGKWSYLHNTVGGQLSKYTGKEKADQILDEAWGYIKYFHPDNSAIMFSEPKKEPDFIMPYFNLRMAPTYHIGTNYLHDMGKRWYNWLVEKGIKFIWEKEVIDINFKHQLISMSGTGLIHMSFDKLIYGTGKSGIDLTQKLINKYNLKKEPKAVQLGVRMELPQKYMQPIIDIAYDFKLYKRYSDTVSVRSFCSNSFAAYVAEETTYGMKSYNGHSYKQEDMMNLMTNFGIIMEIKGIDKPFEFQKDIVAKCQFDGKGLHYSPHYTRIPSLTAEGNKMNVISTGNVDVFTELYGEYSEYIMDYINDLNKVFKFDNDYSLYIPEVKFLSEEVLVNYKDLSLIDYPNIHFVGDALSARGIAVSAAQGVYAVENLTKIK